MRRNLSNRAVRVSSKVSKAKPSKCHVLGRFRSVGWSDCQYRNLKGALEHRTFSLRPLNRKHRQRADTLVSLWRLFVFVVGQFLVRVRSRDVFVWCMELSHECLHDILVLVIFHAALSLTTLKHKWNRVLMWHYREIFLMIIRRHCWA